jgi:hypothetical protein
MTLFLTACFLSAVALTAATGLLVILPATRAELAIWRRLRIQSLRRRLTRTRHVDQPLEAGVTARIARRNLHWHLVLSGLFTAQLGAAIGSEGRWWRPLAAPLIVFCVAYFAGSLVQRQKLVVLQFSAARIGRQPASVARAPEQGA